MAAGTCSWYNVGMIFVYNTALMALLTPLLEYIRFIDWGVRHPPIIPVNPRERGGRGYPLL